MNRSCFIIDDEPHALAVLEDYISRTPGLEMAGAFTDPLAALEALHTARATALVFLDVDMPEINGVVLAGLLDRRHTVVFSTSYREYGPEAYEQGAADYLLKPIAYERFLKCIARLKTGPEVPEPGYFFIRTDTNGKMQKVRIADIYYISGLDNYIELYFKEQRLIAYLTMQEIMANLPEEGFSRIHRSFIISHAHLQVIEPGQVRLSDNSILPVGRAFRKGFQEKMKGHFLVSVRGK